MEPGSSHPEAAVPDPSECRGPDDVGKLIHDEEGDLWYECMDDTRRKVYTWVIIPPPH